MMRVLAEGWFCTKCEVFENDDNVDTRTDPCQECGCPGGDHTPAEIVSRGYGA